MPGISAVRKIIPTRSTTSGTGPAELYSSVDGALHNMPWREARIWEGKGFYAKAGAFSTPIAGSGASLVISLVRPNMVISIPSGTTMIPIRIHAQLQNPLLATDSDESEVLFAVDRTAVSNASASTGTVYVPLNMRTDFGATGSAATCVITQTSDVTSPTLGLDLAHSVVVGDVQGTAATALWTKHELLYEPVAPPLLVGPCALFVYWGGTVATTGFVQANWIEVPTPPSA